MRVRISVSDRSMKIARNAKFLLSWTNEVPPSGAQLIYRNSTSNEKFSVKTLEDQLKSMCCIYYMISKVVFLGHCVKVK